MPEPSYSKPTTQSSRRLSLISNSGSATSEAPMSNGHSRAPSYGRPGTSQTFRPDSAMSSRGHSIPPVVVKKTRAPAQPRGDAPKPSRVRKKSPLNDGASVVTESSSTSVPQLASNDVVLPTTEAPNSQISDIDSLTSGMKKIKLSLTTKAQREAKEQAKPSKAASKPAAIKPAKPRAEKPMTETRIIPASAQSVSTSNRNPATSETLPPMPATPQQSLPPHLPSHIQQAAEVPLPASSPPGPQPQREQGPALPQPAPQVAARPATNSDVFIPYQPEGPPPATIIQQEPLKWLPPNTATPSPMKRNDLPVFTSTGAIPFGIPRVNSEVKKEENKEQEHDIWEVPETPKK